MFGNVFHKSCLFIYAFLYSIKIGKDQVAVGLAPINFDNKSSESALSIYPIAIGNCKEKRLVALKSGIMINETIMK